MRSRHLFAPLRRLALAALFTAATLGGAVAHAGDVKFGVDRLEVDESGALTEAGAAAAVNELRQTEGDNSWDLNLWIKLDKKLARTPIYVEFHELVDGAPQLVWRNEDQTFDGGTHASLNMLLEGVGGFKADTKYEVRVLIAPKGKDKLVAKAELTLLPPEESAEEPEPESTPEPEAESEPAEAESPEPAGDEAPPEVEPGAKKGCAIDRDAGGGALPLALLLLLGVGRRRR